MRLAQLVQGKSERLPKRFQQGTHRSLSPAETLARVQRFMPVMGITRIGVVTGLDTIGIPVVMVCRPNSRSLSVFQGKGVNLPAAKASGVMEAVELYHAEHVHQPLLLGSVAELRRRYQLAQVELLPQLVTSPLHPELPLLWVEGEDLLQGGSVWMPYEMVHANYTFPLPTGSGCFGLSTNGLASGNHPAEALSHGICEVIERDATTLWELLDEEAQRATRLDLESVDDPICRQVLEQYERASIAVGVWDATSDVGVPTFICLITPAEEELLHPTYSAWGKGCHPAREVALVRALTEAAQSRLTAITGARDDIVRPLQDWARSPESQRRDRDLIQARGPRRSFQSVPTWNAETLNEDIAWVLERLRAVGITQVLALDLTRPEFGLPVVRVIIPGLEGPTTVMELQPGPRARRILEKRE